MTLIVGHNGPDFALVAADDRMWNTSAGDVRASFDGDQKVLRTARGWIAATSFYDARLSTLASVSAAHATDGRPQSVARSFVANFRQAAHHLYPDGPPEGAEDVFGARIFIADGSGETPRLLEVDTFDCELRRKRGSLLNGPKDIAWEVQEDLALSLDASEGLADAVRRTARVLLRAREHSDRIGPRLRAAAVVARDGRLARPSWFARAERLAGLSDRAILDAAQGVPDAPAGSYRRDGQTRRVDTQAGEILSGMQLNSGVKGSDGARSGSTAKITEKGAASDVEDINFPTSYQNVPLWRPTGGHKVVPDAAFDGVVAKVELENAGPGGGTVKAHLEEVVSGSDKQDESASFSADTHGEVGVNDDDYSADMGAADPAWDDLYDFYFDITAFGSQTCFDGECWCAGGTFTVGAYINDGSGPELVETYGVSAECSDVTENGVKLQVSYAGLSGHSGKEFWMGVESGEGSGEYTADRVEWQSSTTANPATVSATSDGSDNDAYPARWFAQAKEDG